MKGQMKLYQGNLVEVIRDDGYSLVWVRLVSEPNTRLFMVSVDNLTAVFP
jgi:hypothetical protein